MRSIVTRSIMLASSFMLASCAGDRTTRLTDEMAADSISSFGVPDVPATLVLTPSSIPPLDIGASVTVVGAVYTAAGKYLPRIPHWSSADSTIASVGASGVILARKAGTVVVSLTQGGLTATLTIVVKPATPTPPLPVKTVVVTLASPSLSIGATTQATATATDSLGRLVTGQAIVWTSVSPTIATVSASGLVTAVSAGTSAIMATVAGVSGSAVVTVVPASPLPVTGSTPATLPQVLLNTTAPNAPAAGGTIISVASGGSFQTALNNARPGDVIELASGATYTGNFVLLDKSTTSTNWIVIRPSNASGLPAQGSRMTPSIAAALALPKVVSPNNQGAFVAAPGAHHYRIIGLDVTATAPNTGLVRFGSGYETTLAQLPHDLVLDRMYVHGASSLSVRRCITLNSASSAVVDSYLSDCHDNGSDSQAIAGWNGSGPFKIVNNYLEAAGETIMFGGADPVIPNLIPSDIEIRRNHFTRPTSWKGVWLIKNLFELKSAQRVLVEGNLFENNWISGQAGTAIVLKSANQDGTAPWQGTRDVTFRLNVVRNVGGGFTIEALNDARPGVVSFHTARMTITDNVVHTINQGIFDGSGNGFLLVGDPSDLIIAHNTIVSPTNSAMALSPGGYVIQRLSLRDNILGGGLYGIKADGLAGGSVSLNSYAPGNVTAANVLILASATGYPLGNFFPSTLSGVGFTNAASLDFHLSASSLYKGKATDGRDPGANVDGVNAAIAGVVVP